MLLLELLLELVNTQNLNNTFADSLIYGMLKYCWCRGFLIRRDIGSL